MENLMHDDAHVRLNDIHTFSATSTPYSNRIRNEDDLLSLTPNASTFDGEYCPSLTLVTPESERMIISHNSKSRNILKTPHTVFSKSLSTGTTGTYTTCSNNWAITSSEYELSHFDPYTRLAGLILGAFTPRSIIEEISVAVASTLQNILDQLEQEHVFNENETMETFLNTIGVWNTNIFDDSNVTKTMHFVKRRSQVNKSVNCSAIQLYPMNPAGDIEKSALYAKIKQHYTELKVLLEEKLKQNDHNQSTNDTCQKLCSLTEQYQMEIKNHRYELERQLKQYVKDYQQIKQEIREKEITDNRKLMEIKAQQDVHYQSIQKLFDTKFQTMSTHIIDSLSNINSKYDDMNNQMRVVNSKCDEMNNGIQNEESKYDDVNNQMRAVNSKFEDMKNYIQNHESKYEDMLNQFKTVNSKLEEVKHQIQTTNSKFNEVKSENEISKQSFELKNNVQISKRDLECMQKTIKMLYTENEKLNLTLKKHNII